ncbi:MAG TPA: GNAT family N-acetyltransferase [Blastocatellia bacterium]|jgi:predicted GNAT superfamily acetyltransferase|nr:GNAT family N-acetyltransferase [Blastocatellia bacterium]
MKSDVIIPQYAVRQCETIEEFEACVEMQRDVWQFSDLDITPLRSYVVTRNSGGFTLGAFDPSNKLLGFSHALAAFDEKLRPYYYSQMLAVEPPLQNAGIGVKLKWGQRDQALKTGVPLITWTFDPLQSRNAHLNIVKLGGVVRRYWANYYGANSSSVLHRGLSTDRLFIEWWVRSPRVAGALEGVRRADKPEAVVEVPRDIAAIKKRDMDEARRWQSRIREGFQKYLSEGLYCAGFEADPKTDSRYLFFKDDQQEKEENYKQ